MTALRFQTGGGHQTSLASLWCVNTQAWSAVPPVNLKYCYFSYMCIIFSCTVLSYIYLSTITSFNMSGVQDCSTHLRHASTNNTWPQSTTDLCGSSEGHLVDFWVIGQRSTSSGAVAWQHGHHTSGDTNLGEATVTGVFLIQLTIKQQYKIATASVLQVICAVSIVSFNRWDSIKEPVFLALTLFEVSEDVSKLRSHQNQISNTSHSQYRALGGTVSQMNMQKCNWQIYNNSDSFRSAFSHWHGWAHHTLPTTLPIFHIIAIVSGVPFLTDMGEHTTLYKINNNIYTKTSKIIIWS